MILFWIAALVFFVCFFIPIYRRSDVLYPSSIIFITFALPELSGAIGYYVNDRFTFMDSTIQMTSLILIVTASCYFAAYHFGRNNIFHKILGTLSLKTTDLKNRLPILIGALSIIYVALLMALISLTGQNPLDSALFFRIRASHDFGVLYAPYTIAPLYILIISYIYHFTKQTTASNITRIIVTIAVLTHALLSGERALMVQVIFAIGIFYGLFKQKPFRFKHLAILAIFFFPFFIIYNIYRVVGPEGLSAIFREGVDIFFILEIVFRFDLIFNTLKVVEETTLGHIHFLYGRSFIDALLIFVPRSIYVDKPLFTNMEIHKYFSNTSLDIPDFASGYMMAEAYLNLHLLGVALYAVIWGLFTRAMDQYYTEAKDNVFKAAGFVFFYIPSLLKLTFPQMGFNGMTTQAILINFAVSLLVIKMLNIKGQEKTL